MHTSNVNAVSVHLSVRKSYGHTIPPVVHRPWGTYESLAIGPHFQVKRIIVHPDQSLSLQYHNYRAEHWTVVEGTALIRIDDSEKELTQNQSVYIPSKLVSGNP